ncbi:PAS domain-containing sensor histidine kinase [Pseudomonas sp. 1D4]|uniref:KinB sensor domain-containing domain n=1 Tax=Pseudomonadaceae TaxID=135621 RepID=UPI00084B5519|nr:MULTISPECIES: KinB sensor domain-containing domain [Pseudomonas]OEC38894.1 PAS domain-containing sensor histidine kinase [Pseudomonas sp. 1D4]
MRFPMKLRTRLFLSISALITVALLGLLLGVTSVMQLARSQEQLIAYNFSTIDLGEQMRRHLGDQLVLLTAPHTDPVKLHDAQQHFRSGVERGLMNARDAGTREGFRAIAEHFARFVEVSATPASDDRQPMDDVAFSEALNATRNAMLDLQRLALDNISSTERYTRERAVLVAGLLGLLALAVLLIGVVTAHGIARRFGAPIEALARAADRIGQGDFQVTLPLSSVSEMASLSRRFGLMAEALRQLKETNIEKMLAEQRRLKAVLDSIDDGLLILDRDGRIEHANPVAQRQLAWDTEQLGQPLSRALAVPALEETTRRVLAGQALDQVHPDLDILAEGEHRLLSWRLTPVSLDDARVLGAVMVLRDVTEQRAFERVRNEFVLRASHELRTPVTGMQMAFGLLRERVKVAPDSREADLLQTVDEEMLRLVRLINDLLHFSRYQNGMQPLTLAPCDLDELLGGVRERFLAQAGERQVAIELDLQGPLPRVPVDRPQLERVLDNLMSNALRHAPRDGRIRLQSRRHGERVILSVEDNGDGVPYSQQARIFEPFVQLGHNPGGVGLGLALCKEIVRLHGGRIGIYSRPGEGAQFYLTLPV